MMTTQRTYWCTITTLEGQPLCTVLITRERPEQATPAGVPAPDAVAPARPHELATRGNGDPRMTDPQKRYLFRLLAQRRLDGPAAETHLKEAFQVATLREVSRTAASQLIEELLAPQTEGTHARA